MTNFGDALRNRGAAVFAPTQDLDPNRGVGRNLRALKIRAARGLRDDALCPRGELGRQKPRMTVVPTVKKTPTVAAVVQQPSAFRHRQCGAAEHLGVVVSRIEIWKLYAADPDAASARSSLLSPTDIRRAGSANPCPGPTPPDQGPRPSDAPCDSLGRRR